ncbi:MAG: hypothetical protein Q4G03_08220 [Planctomycetia bacterium]|nr:hypothetical protein [Planctomycetia bacterium]
MRVISLILITFVALCSGASLFGAEPQHDAAKDAVVARETVCQYMRDAAAIEWTPAEDIKYWTTGEPFTFKSGETYFGIPYTQNARDHDLASFKTKLESRDGRLTYFGPNTPQLYWGNDCSSCVSHAWRRVDPEFPTLDTLTMLPNRQERIATVGDYQVGQANTTQEIVESNGAERIARAYAQLQPGDAVLRRLSSGHVMLVLKNDPENRRVFIADQTGCDQGVPMGRDGRSTMRVDHEQSYDRLLKNFYIPIRLKAIADLEAQACQE